MKNKFLYLICGSLFLFNVINAQEIQRLDPDEIHSAKISSEKIYEGDSLFAYTRGGAELYLAYNADKLCKQEIELNGEMYTIMIWEMADPASAFGIYSICKNKCDTIPRITRNQCASPNIYIAERNRFYYSIINHTGSRQARVESIEFARTLAGKIHPDSIPWPDIFDYDLFIGYQQSLKLIHGNIALQLVLPAWSKYFESTKNFKAWYLPVETEKSGSFYLALISFNEASDCKLFIRTNSIKLQKAGDPNPENAKLGWKIGEKDLIYLDATEFKETLRPYTSALEQYINKIPRRK
jgi:hypothetical protein